MFGLGAIELLVILAIIVPLVAFVVFVLPGSHKPVP